LSISSSARSFLSCLGFRVYGLGFRNPNLEHLELSALLLELLLDLQDRLGLVFCLVVVAVVVLLLLSPARPRVRGFRVRVLNSRFRVTGFRV
jgi:hypothetical protein